MFGKLFCNDSNKVNGRHKPPLTSELIFKVGLIHNINIISHSTYYLNPNNKIKQYKIIRKPSLASKRILAHQIKHLVHP